MKTKDVLQLVSLAQKLGLAREAEDIMSCFISGRVLPALERARNKMTQFGQMIGAQNHSRADTFEELLRVSIAAETEEE